jgi:hypothetical protein
MYYVPCLFEDSQWYKVERKLSSVCHWSGVITVQFTPDIHGTVFQHLTCLDIRGVQHNVPGLLMLEILKDLKVDCYGGLLFLGLCVCVCVCACVRARACACVRACGGSESKLTRHVTVNIQFINTI